MFEQDYVMRMIKEMIRFLLKVFFHYDSESVSDSLLKETVDRQELNSLLDLADKGRINEAENKLFDIPDDGTRKSLGIALLFYSHLNEMTDEYLKEHGFSRDEIVSGLHDVAKKKGVDGLSDMFLDRG